MHKKRIKGGIKLELKSLVLKNFKGIESLSLDFNGKNASIFADNGIGKTTIFDAYNWLLTGKDSLNRKDFGIKTYDGKGGELHNLNHEVEAEFINPSLKLRRIYREKYTKVKGSPIPEFSGHTTDYFVNDLEAKEAEFKIYINGAVNENQFKLLSNPLYFNVSLKWEEKRKILFEMCGETKDSDILATEEFKELASLIEPNNVFQHETIIDAKLKNIDKQIKDIPVRISEAQNSIQGLDNLNLNDLKHALEVTKNSKDLKIKERTQVLAGGSDAKLKNDIVKAETDIQEFVNKFNKIQSEFRMAQFKLLEAAIKKHSAKLNEIEHNTTDIVKITKEIAEKEAEKAKKLGEYKKIDASTHLEVDRGNICPTCEQQLPSEKVEEAKLKALEAFNLKKSEDLSHVKSHGMALKLEIELLDTKLQNLKNKTGILTTEYEAFGIEKKELESDKESPIVDTQVEYKALDAIKDVLEKQLAQCNDTPADDSKLAEIDKILAVLTTNETEITENIIKLESSEKTKTRIATLKAEEKSLSLSYANYSRQKDLCEKFTKAKITMVEGLINSKFSKAKFKLFDVQINGTIKECCEAMYEGVPFSDLNNAMKINLGLDIINTLSDHYKTSTHTPLKIPIFVDNAESVTKLEESDTQIIRLVVSENDKTLRMEVDNHE